MNKLLIILGMIFCTTQGHAQIQNNNSAQDLLKAFRDSVVTEFDTFRSRVKKEHLDFMRQEWQKFESMRPVPKPKDEFVPPVVMPKEEQDKPHEDRQIVVEEVVMPISITDDTNARYRYKRRARPQHKYQNRTRPRHKTQPAPVKSQQEPVKQTPVKEEPVIEEPVIEEPVIEEPTVEEPTTVDPIVIEPVTPVPLNMVTPLDMSFLKLIIKEETNEIDFYGTPLKIAFNPSKMVRLKGVREKNIGDGFEALASSKDCEILLHNCLAIRKELNLNDWAYLQLLKTIAYEIGGGCNNESTLLLAYLYMRSGYKMRLAKDDKRIYMLYASSHQIYDKPSYYLDDDSYYSIEDLPSSLYICDVTFDKMMDLSLILNHTPLFKENVTERRVISSERYSDVKVNISVNKNLLDFYSSYPSSMYGENMMTRWAIYANTPLQEKVKEELYPQLRNFIEGKTQLEAANILLNWVQTGFEYEYDDKVWGGDRAFFAEETLHYPYCDCEDRSILFTRLVRDLLGLQCMLVFYPGHLASAVCFTEPVNGDYIQVSGKNFIVSDPTYIGASVGRTMPQMNNQTAKVIVLD